METGTQWNSRVTDYYNNPTLFRKLRQQTVSVIGLGSVGSIVAEYLAMSGIERFILVDPKTFEKKNVVRHALNSRYVGWPKVSGVKDLILHRNLEAKVRVEQADIGQSFGLLKRADIVVVCVDDEPTRSAINMHARSMGKTVVTAGVYAKGAGGDVFIVYPTSGACYSCIASYLVDDSEPETDTDYGQARTNKTLAAEPGLAIDVAAVAVQQAKIALHTLRLQLDNTTIPLPGNVYIMANAPRVIQWDETGNPVDKLNMGEAKWYTLPRKEGCRVCDIRKKQPNTFSVEDLLAQ